MTITTISQAIDRSISHDEIVSVDMSDLARGLRAEAITAGDLAMVDMCNVVIGGTDIRYRKALPIVVRCLVDCGGMEATDTDDVENGDVWEMWGTTEDGDYRVHIRLDA